MNNKILKAALGVSLVVILGLSIWGLNGKVLSNKQY